MPTSTCWMSRHRSAIEVTLGELDDDLKNLDAYGMYVRGFDAETENIEDEPERNAETVLTVKLTVASDLEPISGRWCRNELKRRD